jgi:hypothetical protein
MHALEFDDTPGVERVRLTHRTGSMFEFHPLGDKVERIVKDRYSVVMGSDKMIVYGQCDITVNGNATLLVKGDYDTRVEGNWNIHVGKDMNYFIKGNEVRNIAGSYLAKTGEAIKMQAESNMMLKASTIHLNSGQSLDIPELNDFDLPAVPAEPFSAAAQERLIQQTGSNMAPNDDKEESPQASLQGETVANNTMQPVVSDGCPELGDGSDLTNADSRYRTHLSKYFQLADVTIRAEYKHHLVAQNNKTVRELGCNLKNICQNVLDPLMEKYPGFKINGGFRTRQNGRSQHEFGEAVDLQWTSIRMGNLSKYLEIANWIKDNLPFDQLILEHGNTCWIHVSLKRTGYGTNRKQVLTMYQNRYEAGLSLKGRV